MRGAPGLLLVGHTVLLRLTDLKRPAFRVACIVRVQNANILFRAGTVTTCQSPTKSCACASLVFLQGSPPWPCATVVPSPSGYRKGDPQNHISCARNGIAVSNVLQRIVENAIPPKPEINLNNIQQLTPSCSRIPCLPFRNTKWSMLRRKIITVYFENHTKQINRAGKIQGFLTSQQVGHT